MVTTLESVTEADRALVFGLGGGGDVVGAISTARFLQLLGLEVALGGIAWEPMPRDVRPGPRPLDELVGIERCGERIARVSPDTETIDRTPIAEAGVAKHLDEPVYVFDVSAGPDPLLASLETHMEQAGYDLLIGVDAGGDALAIGDEAGLKSPLTDAIGLDVLRRTNRESLIGVIGYGSDGELRPAELDDAVGELAGAGGFLGAWGITPTVRDELERVLEDVATEASRLPVAAARGVYGPQDIRGGNRRATVGPMSPITLYFDPSVVACRSSIVDVVADAPSLERAAKQLADRGIRTEFDLER